MKITAYNNTLGGLCAPGLCVYAPLTSSRLLEYPARAISGSLYVAPNSRVLLNPPVRLPCPAQSSPAPVAK